MSNSHLNIGFIYPFSLRELDKVMPVINNKVPLKIRPAQHAISQGLIFLILCESYVMHRALKSRVYLFEDRYYFKKNIFVVFLRKVLLLIGISH